jgi:hypothetical protein
MECTGQLIYHPQRYREMRPFFHPLYKIFRNTCAPDGCPTTSGMMAMHQKFIQIWNEELDHLPIEKRPENIKRFNEEISIFCHVASSIYTGRNIFHLQPELSSLLRETDVDEIEWRLLHLPYPNIYLWFGKQKDWPLSSNHYVDGAYIEYRPGEQGLQITLTSVADSYPDWLHQNFVMDFDPYYYAIFEFSPDGKSTVGESLKSLLEKDPNFHPENEQQISDEQIEKYRNEGINVLELPPERSGWYQNALEHQENLPIFLQALRLVINGLCFLSAEPDDIVTEFPTDTIETVVSNSQGLNNPKQVGTKEVKKIHSHGYTKIHFCGNQFVKAAQRHDGIGTGSEMPPHRRRAFWRNQPCGVGRLENRLTWIRPTIVRKDRLKDEEDAPGHTYIVR